MGLFSRLTRADLVRVEHVVDVLSDDLKKAKDLLKRRTLEIVNLRSRVSKIEEFLESAPLSVDGADMVEEEVAEPDIDLSQDRALTREEQRLRVGGRG